EVKVELKKVVFPDRDTVIDSTKVVILTVFIISLFLGFVDIGLSKLVSLSLR
ncbi:MAG: preprotein translocase subunit SecE, partial [Thermodesulfovibrionia bacterium]|nr:preprotein translocase subunit SecE [Thermodesulfovibrionia bacterium]